MSADSSSDYGPREAALRHIEQTNDNYGGPYIALNHDGETVCLDGDFDLATLVRLVHAMSLPIA